MSEPLLPTRESRAYRRGFRAGHEAAQKVAEGEAERLRAALEEVKERAILVQRGMVPLLWEVVNAAQAIGRDYGGVRLASALDALREAQIEAEKEAEAQVQKGLDALWAAAIEQAGAGTEASSG
jgi:hypothetical protein